MQVEREVRRLEQLKSTKMKELVQRKKLELEEICKSTHLTTKTVFSSGHPIESFDSGKFFIRLLHNDFTLLT